MKQQYLFALEHSKLINPLQAGAILVTPQTTNPEPKPLPLGHTPENPLHFVSEVDQKLQRARQAGKMLVLAGLGILTYVLLSSGRQFGITDKKVNVAETSSVRFSDVKGIDECKEELQEIVAYLRDPHKFMISGAKLPKGLLLTGQPGTGKTLLAKAIAGEAGVKFFYASGSDFEEVFVGLGAKRVRELFDEAKRNAPCIVFIDEIDALGGSRASKDINFNRQSLNQLLVELDGFQPSDNVIVIGATNLPDNLDNALKRSGRFDKEVNIPLPEIKGREEIFELYLSKVKHDPSVNVRSMAAMTFGMTGADIANIVNIAVLNSVKAQRDGFNMEDFDYAIERTLMGVERKSLAITQEEKMNTALHEIGHVMAILNTHGTGKLYKVNILPRGNALGVTVRTLDKDQHYETFQELLANIDVSMGGRCAEELFTGRESLTTGCGSDMANAVKYAYKGVMEGMFSELTGVFYADNLERQGMKQRNMIDNTVEQVLTESRQRVMKLLKDNKGLVLYLAKHLQEREVLSAFEIEALVQSYSKGR